MVALIVALAVAAGGTAFARRVGSGGCGDDDGAGLRAAALGVLVVAAAMAAARCVDAPREAAWAAASALAACAIAARGGDVEAGVAAASAAQLAAVVVVTLALARAGAGAGSTGAPGASDLVGVAWADARLVVVSRAVGIVSVGASIWASTRGRARSPWVGWTLALLGTVGAAAALFGRDAAAPALFLVLGVALGAALDILSSRDGPRGAWGTLAAIACAAGVAAWVGARSAAPQGAALGIALVTTGAFAAAPFHRTDRTAIALACLASLALVAAYAVGAGDARCAGWVAREELPVVAPELTFARCEAAGIGWLAPDPSRARVVVAAAAGVALAGAQVAARFARVRRAIATADIAPALVVAAVALGGAAAETVVALVMGVVAAATCVGVVMSRGSATSQARSLVFAGTLCAATAAALAPLAR
jgi:hypothetical protein